MCKKRTMKYMVILILLTLSPFQAIAQEIGSKEKDLMNQIIFACSDIPALKFPRPEIYVDRELQDFQSRERWFKRDLGLLKAISKDIESSTFIMRGKPISEHISNCKKEIAVIQRELKKEIVAKPNKKALAKIEDALRECQWANGWIDNRKKENTKFNSIETYYNYYLEHRDAAISMDKRVASWKAQEIEKCNNTFVPKFLALKKEKEKENAAKMAIQKAKKLKHQKKLDAAYEAKKERAISLGYKGIYEGLMFLIDELNEGYSSIEDVKPYLIEPQSSDRFFVSSIVNDYVIYGYHRNSREYIQIAVVKESGDFYGHDAPLPYGLYMVKGVNDFVTVLGARQQLIILKRVSE